MFFVFQSNHVVLSGHTNVGNQDKSLQVGFSSGTSCNLSGMSLLLKTEHSFSQVQNILACNKCVNHH